MCIFYWYLPFTKQWLIGTTAYPQPEWGAPLEGSECLWIIPGTIDPMED